MYRYLLLVLLWQAAAPAPQATDSDITYVKPQPPAEAPAAPSHYRESRIENLPLTIPGNITFEAVPHLTDKPYRNETKIETNSDLTLPESSNLAEVTALPVTRNEKIAPQVINPDTNLPQETDASTAESHLPEEIDTTVETNQETLPESTVQSNIETELPERTDEDELLEADGSVSDTIPAQTYQSGRRARTYDSSETTDIFEEATERHNTQPPEVDIPRTIPTQFPKLSYFKKPQVFASFPTNSLEKSARRRFRSRCRCEKIWNCPKLQITVPRCPDEYFLCCF